MGPRGQMKWRIVMMAGFVIVLLACGPLDRFRPTTPPPTATASETTLLRANSQLIARAYQVIETLPGYRLETRHLVRDEAGQLISQVIITKAYDPAGNLYSRSQARDGTLTAMTRSTPAGSTAVQPLRLSSCRSVKSRWPTQCVC